ncbi:MAG: hypothetical protein KAV70_06365 [Bacteroidales bacterium]|nr:hypothetical protein [Bacteroidales bacterium]
MKNNIIKIVLAIVIITLAYFVYESILEPVRFKKEKNIRELEVIQRLKDIRTSQMIYRAINNKYTASFDTLVEFLHIGEIPIVNIIPDPEDTTFTKTINDTIGYINVGDSLFGKRPNFVIEEIRFIPFTDTIEFEMDAGEIEQGKVKVNVLEISALYKYFLKGLDNQLIINLIKSKNEIDRFPGLKLGSMTEASTDGNWEF